MRQCGQLVAEVFYERVRLHPGEVTFCVFHALEVLCFSRAGIPGLVALLRYLDTLVELKRRLNSLYLSAECSDTDDRTNMFIDFVLGEAGLEQVTWIVLVRQLHIYGHVAREIEELRCRSSRVAGVMHHTNTTYGDRRCMYEPNFSTDHGHTRTVPIIILMHRMN